MIIDIIAAGIWVVVLSIICIIDIGKPAFVGFFIALLMSCNWLITEIQRYHSVL